MAAQRCVFGSDMKSQHKLVALALLAHWSKGSDTFPSVVRLAAYTSLGRASVIRSIGALRASGAILVTDTKGRSNRYDLTPLMHLGSNANPSQADTTTVSHRYQSQADTSLTERHHPSQADTTLVSEGALTGIRLSPEGIHVRDPEKRSREGIHIGQLPLVTESDTQTKLGKPTKPKRPSKPARWSRVPETWQPNDDHWVLAVELRVSVDSELPKFRDHEFAKPKTDADACFRTWLRNAAKFSTIGTGGRYAPAQPSHPDTQFKTLKAV
jgi:hypothetical protein